MVSDGVGVVSGWFRVVSGLEVSGQCQVLSGHLSVCRYCRAVGLSCTRLQVLSVLSGCRVVGFRVLSGGVGLSCRGCVGESSLTLWCQACIKV